MATLKDDVATLKDDLATSWAQVDTLEEEKRLHKVLYSTHSEEWLARYEKRDAQREERREERQRERDVADAQ